MSEDRGCRVLRLTDWLFPTFTPPTGALFERDGGLLGIDKLSRGDILDGTLIALPLCPLAVELPRLFPFVHEAQAEFRSKLLVGLVLLLFELLFELGNGEIFEPTLFVQSIPNPSILLRPLLVLLLSLDKELRPNGSLSLLPGVVSNGNTGDMFPNIESNMWNSSAAAVGPRARVSSTVGDMTIETHKTWYFLPVLPA